MELKQEVPESVFGAFGPEHAFNAFIHDWGIKMTGKLTEPEATKYLSYLLNRGKPELRAARIRAFLEALEIPGLPDNPVLERAKVFAERDDIDLEIQFPMAAGSPLLRIVIVESKFGRVLTEGQLSKYYNTRKKDPKFVKLDCRIIGLTPEAGEGRKGWQYRIWPVYLWHDVWLRFEERRPREPDEQFAAFADLLWRRIGGPTPKSQ